MLLMRCSGTRVRRGLLVVSTLAATAACWPGQARRKPGSDVVLPASPGERLLAALANPCVESSDGRTAGDTLKAKLCAATRVDTAGKAILVGQPTQKRP